MDNETKVLCAGFAIYLGILGFIGWVVIKLMAHFGVL